MPISANFYAVAPKNARISAGISFFCAVCGESLSVDASLAGETIPCVSCRRTVPVPGYPPSRKAAACAPVFPPEVLSVDLRFFCGHCHAKLTADARWEGREMHCPSCAGTITVPWWSRPRPTQDEATEATGRLTPEELAFLTGEPNTTMP